jgi:hypothetical protein
MMLNGMHPSPRTSPTGPKLPIRKLLALPNQKRAEAKEKSAPHDGPRFLMTIRGISMATADLLVSLPCGRAAPSPCTANYQIKRQEPHNSVQEPTSKNGATRTTGHKITPTHRGCLRHIRRDR